MGKSAGSELLQVGTARLPSAVRPSCSFGHRADQARFGPVLPGGGAGRIARRGRKWCRARPPRWPGWPTLGASSCTLPCACGRPGPSGRTAGDLDPVPGVDWKQIREVAAVARSVLDDTLWWAGPRRPARAASMSSCGWNIAGASIRCAGPPWRWPAKSSGARPRWRRASGGRKSATGCLSTTTRTPRTGPSRPPTRCGRPVFAGPAAGPVGPAGSGRRGRCALAAALPQAGR